LARAFNSSFHTVEWVILAHQVASMVFGVGIGRLSDIVGYRRVFLYGAALFTASALLCGFAPTLSWLVGFRRGDQLCTWPSHRWYGDRRIRVAGSIFHLGAVGVLAIVLAHHRVPAGSPPSRDGEPRFDWVGTLLLGTGVSAFSLAVTLRDGGFGATNAGLAIAAAVAACLFVFSEFRTVLPFGCLGAYRYCARRR
jgi:hypothetical protein